MFRTEEDHIIGLRIRAQNIFPNLNILVVPNGNIFTVTNAGTIQINTRTRQQLKATNNSQYKDIKIIFYSMNSEYSHLHTVEDRVPESLNRKYDFKLTTDYRVFCLKHDFAVSKDLKEFLKPHL
jgi:hypothetical protein